MGNYDFVRFTKRDAYDFKDVILPNIMDDLMVTQDFNKKALLCLGALDGTTPVAALIAQLLEGNEVFIHSLYVKEDHRRKGIGKGLMDSLLTEAAAEFDTRNVLESSSVSLFVHADYSFTEEDTKAFDSYLRSCGFTDFMEKKPSYIIPSNVLRKSALTSPAFRKDFTFAPQVHSLTAEAQGNDEELMTLLDSFGVDAEPDYCVVFSREDTPCALMFSEYGMDNSFFISDFRLQDLTEAESVEMLRTCLNVIAKDYKNFEIIVSGEASEMPELWAELSSAGGSVFSHKEAGMYVVFE